MIRSVVLLSAIAILASPAAFSSDFTLLLSDDNPLVLFQDAGDAEIDGLKLMLIEAEDDEKPHDLEQPAAEAGDSTPAPRGWRDDTPAPVDDSSSGPEAQAGEQDRSSRRIAELQKPATELNIAPPTAGADDVPINQASTLLDQPPRWILASEASVHLARRVHVPFFHQPTYYQELNLERCGRLDCPQYGCLQNAYSSLWFLGNTVMLPYRVAAQPHCECVRGYGDCSTCQGYDCSLEPLQLEASEAATRRGLVSQSAAVAGFAFLLL